MATTSLTFFLLYIKDVTLISEKQINEGNTFSLSVIFKWFSSSSSEEQTASSVVIFSSKVGNINIGYRQIAFILLWKRTKR